MLHSVRNVVVLENSLSPLQIAQSKGVPFFLYDFARTDLTFQQVIGVNSPPAVSVTDPVALAIGQDSIGLKTLDQVISEAPEMVVNGDFPTNLSGWTVSDVGAGATAVWDSGGRVSLPRIDASNFGRVYQQITGLTVGRLYRVRMVGVGQVAVRLGSGIGQAQYVLATASSGEVVSYFIASATTAYVSLQANTNGAAIYADDVSVKEIPGNHAAQTGAGTLRPTRQAGNVVRFDAADDNLLTALTGATAGNAFIAKVTVPVSLAATQVVAGFNAASNGRFQVAINTSGQICAGVGANSTTSHVGTVDHRGQTGVLAVIEDGANVKIYWNGVEEHSAARNGAPDASVPYRLGSNNNNGTAANFFGGDIRFAEALKGAFFTAAEIASISSQWNATP